MTKLRGQDYFVRKNVIWRKLSNHYELVKLHRRIGRAKEETVNVVTRKKLDTAAEQPKSKWAIKSPSRLILCRYCGGKHYQDKFACPAYGKVCRKCGKGNHFQSICKQVTRQSRQSIQLVGEVIRQGIRWCCLPARVCRNNTTQCVGWDGRYYN